MESKICGVEYLDTKSASLNIKELALRGSAAMVFSRSTSAVVQFGSSIVLARLLEPTDFGLFAMVTAFSLLLAMLDTTDLSKRSFKPTKSTTNRSAPSFGLVWDKPGTGHSVFGFLPAACQSI